MAGISMKEQEIKTIAGIGIKGMFKELRRVKTENTNRMSLDG